MYENERLLPKGLGPFEPPAHCTDEFLFRQHENIEEGEVLGGVLGLRSAEKTPLLRLGNLALITTCERHRHDCLPDRQAANPVASESRKLAIVLGSILFPIAVCSKKNCLARVR